MNIFTTRRLRLPLNDVLGKVTDAFMREGFDLVSDGSESATGSVSIGVYYKGSLKRNTNARESAWVVSEEERIVACLPCRVVLRELKGRDKGTVEVAVEDPASLIDLRANPRAQRILGELREKILAVMHRL